MIEKITLAITAIIVGLFSIVYTYDNPAPEDDLSLINARGYIFGVVLIIIGVIILFDVFLV